MSAGVPALSSGVFVRMSTLSSEVVIRMSTLYFTVECQIE